MRIYIRFKQTDQRIPVKFKALQTIAEPVEHETYQGPYEVTPSRSQQTLATGDKLMLRDVVIEPIPQNYGLITYNGFGITVS